MEQREATVSLMALSQQLQDLRQRMVDRHESISALRKKTEKMIYNGSKYRALVIAPNDAFENIHPASPFGDLEECEDFLSEQLTRLSSVETMFVPNSLFIKDGKYLPCSQIKSSVYDFLTENGIAEKQPQIVLPLGIVLSCVVTGTEIKSQNDFAELSTRSRKEKILCPLIPTSHRVFPMIHPEVLHWSRNGAMSLFYETMAAINSMPRLEIDD